MTSGVAIVDWAALSAADRDALLERPAVADDAEVRSAVAAIVDDVRRRGDTAVRELSAKFDGCSPDAFELGEADIEAAAAKLTAASREAIRTAIRNVETFHRAQLPTPLRVETRPGVVCERVAHPVDAVGLYVPAGSAPLPSAAIMLAVPAAIAGCPLRVLCTPPGRDGDPDPAVVYAANRAGVTRIFRIGGAQAIAAMAYGTGTVPRVGKIFGPGNAFVTRAKTLVASEPGGAAIDMPAGPSEVLVVADAVANPDWVAADLLSQAEHGEDSQVVLLATGDGTAERVAQAVAAQLPKLSRAAIAARSLRHARFVRVGDLDTAIDVSNRYAPEHLILQLADPRACLARIRNAGSVFVGAYSPEAVGDYCSGTNHVLPTYGHARQYGSLGVDQFMRTMTVQELTADGLRDLAPTVYELAALEGLDAHAAAVRVRLESQ